MKFLITFAILWLPFTLLSQPKNDSLQALLDKREGKEKIDLLNELSYLHWKKSADKGIQYGKQSLQLSNEYDYPKGEANAYINVGLSYWTKGHYDIAVEYCFKALELGEKLNDTTVIAKTLNNLGVLYDCMGESDQALKYYKKANGYNQQMGNKKDLAKVYGNIGVVFCVINELDSASLYLQKSIEIFKEIDNELGVAGVIFSLGNVQHQLKEYTKALDYFLTANMIFEELGNANGIALSSINIGTTYGNLGDYKKARENIMKGLKVAEETGMKERVMEANKELSWLSKKTNDYKKSLEYYVLYSEIKDSLYNNERSEQIAEMQTKYETEKKEQENLLLKKEQITQNVTIKNQQITVASVIIVAILLLCLAFIIYRDRQKQHKLILKLQYQNKEIFKQKKELIIKTEQVIKQADALREANATKDKFFSIIAHDLRSPFGAILGYANMLATSYNNISEEKRIKFITNIDSAAKNVFKMLENLLNWSMSSQGMIKIEKHDINLKQLVEQNINPYMSNATVKEISVNNNISEDIAVSADKSTIGITIGNIANNAIKFTPFGGQVSVTASKNQDMVEVQIEDTGIGISKDEINNLFRIGKSHTTLGTNKEEGTGLGLILCKEFIEKNGGEIWVESELGVGSKFIFTLPIVS